jgi:choline dehydrogenase
LTEFDYIVVGGGSSGSIVAGELSRDPSKTVLLLECGDSAQENPETLEADGYKRAFVNERLMFERFSVPQAGCANRRLFMGSGRGMGGSGAINAMVYTRGARADYDEWPDAWRWDAIASDFSELERRLRVRRREPTEWTESCIQSAVETGFRRKEDLNDGDLSGVLGYEWMSYEGDKRRSSYVSFLADRIGAPNLRVVTGARAHRIVFEGRRAVGVEYRSGSELLIARARREVVLSAGAIETPRLLMLSGVGPGDVLRAAGLPIVADVPAIGRNFHDHPNVQLFFVGKRPADCNYPELYGFHRAGDSAALAPGQSDTCYVFYPARSSFREGVWKLLPAIALPKPLYEMPLLVRAMRGAISTAFDQRLVQRFVERLWGIVVILGKPRSRGTVRVGSPRAEADPIVDPAYFADPEDLETLARGVVLARRIASSPTARRWGSLEVMPGGHVRDKAQIETFIRKNVMTTYHYAGTCKMTDGESGAVDQRLHLRGVTGIRVADASVIPTTPVAALNAPSMLIGLRAARFIREE